MGNLLVLLLLSIFIAARGAGNVMTKDHDGDHDGGPTVSIDGQHPPAAAYPTYDRLMDDMRHVQKDLEDGIVQLEHDWTEFQNQAYRDVQTLRRRMEIAVQKTTLRYKRIFAESFLSQRVGWNRFRHSVRDHIGFGLGIHVVFRGHTHPIWKTHDHGGRGLSVALQVAQLSWDFLKAQAVLSSLEPWSYDVVSSLIGLSVWRGIQQHHHTERIIQNALSFIFLTHTFFHCNGIILTEWWDQSGSGSTPTNNHRSIILYSACILSGLSFALLKVTHIPQSLAASSISGAVLTYGGYRNEIAGNWFWLLDMLATIVYHFGPLLRGLVRHVVNSLLWIWRLRHNLTVRIPQSIKDGILWSIEVIRSTTSFVWRPLNDLRTQFLNLNSVKRTRAILDRFKRAVRPILMPWALTIWGIAVQQSRIKGIGGIWRYFRLTFDPVSFAVTQVTKWVSVRAYYRRALISFARHQVIERLRKPHGARADHANR